MIQGTRPTRVNNRHIHLLTKSIYTVPRKFLTMAAGFKVLVRRGNCLFEAMEGSLAAVFTHIRVFQCRGLGYVLLGIAMPMFVRWDTLCCTVLLMQQLIIARHQHWYGLSPGFAWCTRDTERDRT
jgi:hypothetical protein